MKKVKLSVFVRMKILYWEWRNWFLGMCFSMLVYIYIFFFPINWYRLDSSTKDERSDPGWWCLTSKLFFTYLTSLGVLKGLSLVEQLTLTQETISFYTDWCAFISFIAVQKLEQMYECITGQSLLWQKAKLLQAISWVIAT